MPRFIARGSVTLKGVVFKITADNIDSARKKVRNGEFDEYETDNGEAIDWEIDTGSVEGN